MDRANREDTTLPWRLRGGDPGRTLWVGGLLLVAASWSGCDDWPHFDYAEVEPQEVQETEVASGPPQNLSYLYGDVGISGEIASSGYVLADSGVPFGLPGWYLGDLDWYQFLLWDRHDSLDASLSWEGGTQLLDLYLVYASPTDGEPYLLSYLEGDPSGRLTLSVQALDPTLVYAAVVAGREGDAVAYRLELHPFALLP